jgi:glyoxylase-like metal-dependent hydrolase (beta-lactamase superfamily II)
VKLPIILRVTELPLLLIRCVILKNIWQLAQERKAKIKYIFETHFHADFVSGHLDLAAATGATIIYGPATVTKFPVHVAKDGEICDR